MVVNRVEVEDEMNVTWDLNTAIIVLGVLAAIAGFLAYLVSKKTD